MQKIGLIAESDELVDKISRLGFDAEFIGRDISALSEKKGRFDFLMIGGNFVLPTDAEKLPESDSETSEKFCESDEKKCAQKLYRLFTEQNAEFISYASELSVNKIFCVAADISAREIFERYDWLDLYFTESDYLSSERSDKSAQAGELISLFENFVLLFPHHGEPLGELIEYVLLNPESDLRQKILSEKLHINKSYLSTVFTAQTGLRFVDYIKNVKLMRAAWLLKNTDLKISEIAGRLEYKDIAYFSKQFKKTFRLTPSEFRIPNSYEFNI